MTTPVGIDAIRAADVVDKTATGLFAWRRAFLSTDGPAPTTRLVLLVLSVHMNGDGASCFPTTKTLSIETGLSERSVCTHLAAAEAEGWIKRNLCGLSGQAWKRNEYTASLPEKVVKQVQHLDKKALIEFQHLEVKGPERVSAPLGKGTEPDDQKALKEVQSSTSYNSSVCGAPEKKTAKRKTPAPDHLPVTESMRTLAREKGFTGDLAELTANFLDFHRAKGNTFADWTAAWRTWLRNEIRFSANRPAGRITPTTAAEGHRGANLITGRAHHA